MKTNRSQLVKLGTVCSFSLVFTFARADYIPQEDWLELETGREQIGTQHGDDFIYGVGVQSQIVYKMNLDGQVLMTIGSAQIPDDYKIKLRTGEPGLLLTKE